MKYKVGDSLLTVGSFFAAVDNPKCNIAQIKVNFSKTTIFLY